MPGAGSAAARPSLGRHGGATSQDGARDGSAEALARSSVRTRTLTASQVNHGVHLRTERWFAFVVQDGSERRSESHGRALRASARTAGTTRSSPGLAGMSWRFWIV